MMNEISGITIIIFMSKLFIIFEILSTQRHEVEGNEEGVTVFGSKFVIALPSVRVFKRPVYVYFAVHTLCLDIGNVTLTKKWAEDQSLQSFSVIKGQHHVVQLEYDFVGHNIPCQSRWTYVLSSANCKFAVQVYLKSHHYKFFASFQAIPETAWTTSYTIITPNFRPSFHVVNGHEKQTVTVYVPADVATLLRPEFKIRDPSGQMLEYYFLQSEEGLSIQMCHGAVKHTTFTGSKVRADFVLGLITGNCINEFEDTKNGSHCVPDLTLDMQRLQTTLSLHYVVAPPMGTYGYLFIMFNHGWTEVTVSGDSLNTLFTTQKDDVSKNFSDTRLLGAHSVSSNRSMTVALLLSRTAPCQRVGFGDITMNIVVPTGLFMDNYYWVTDNDTRYNHSVLVVMKAQQSLFVLLDDLPVFWKFHQKYTRQHFLIDPHISAEVLLKPGYHQLYSINSFRFGAYLFGLASDDHSMCMQSAGFVARPAEYSDQCVINKFMYRGDLIDNDCDGFIDEEKDNQIDDDHDMRVDEDKGESRLENGQWSDWLSWHCESAFADFKRRSRYCNNPRPHNGGYNCRGDHIQLEAVTHESCYDVIRGVVHGNWAITKLECISCNNASGLTKITRECNSPAPRKGGRDCPGSSVIYMEHEECIRNCTKPRSTTPHKNTHEATIAISSTVDTQTTEDSAQHEYSGNTVEMTNSTKVQTNIWSSSSTTTDETTATTTATTTEFDQMFMPNTTLFIPATAIKLYPGEWGEWSQWGCLENCTVKNIVRTRSCLDPPTGPRGFDCSGYAYELGHETACNLICAKTCPYGFWGFNCSKGCPKCDSLCDKATGACTRCKPGYRYPQASCVEECKPFTYGYECLGNCLHKCEGKDCVDKKIGTCPDRGILYYMWYLSLTVIFIPLFLLYRLRMQFGVEEYAEDDDYPIDDMTTEVVTETQNVVDVQQMTAPLPVDTFSEEFDI